MATGEDWFYRAGGSSQPGGRTHKVSKQELAAMLADGTLSPGTLVRSRRTHDCWTPAEDVEELHHTCRKRPQPPRPRQDMAWTVGWWPSTKRPETPRSPQEERPIEQDQWFYSSADENYVGPVEKEQLISLLESRTLTPDALVWHPGMSDWEPIRDVPQIDWRSRVVPPPLPRRGPRRTSEPEEPVLLAEVVEGPAVQALPRRESRRASPPDAPVLPAEVVEGPRVEGPQRSATHEQPDRVKTGAQDKRLGTAWLTFYVYGRLPLGILLTVAEYTSFRALYADEPVTRSVGTVIVGFTLLLLVFLFIGLHLRKLWGWWLNWFVLVYDLVLRSFEKADDPAMFVGLLVVLGLIWLLPNAIYFGKRRCLFS